MATQDLALTYDVIRNFDCGVLSTLRVVNANPTYVEWASLDGTGLILLPSTNYVQLCSGAHTLRGGVDPSSLYAQIMEISLPYTEVLLGLTGIVCGLLIAWAFNRS